MGSKLRFCGARGGIRTPDLPITSQLHYVPVGGLWCCLVPACTVVARCVCWAVTARDCEDRDVRIHHGRTSRHRSVVVAQWTSPSGGRHSQGRVAYLAGDTLEEVIEAARRGIRRVRRTPHLPGRPSRRTGPGLGTHMASIRAALSTKRSGQAGRGRWSLWTTAPHLDVSAPRTPRLEPARQPASGQPRAGSRWPTSLRAAVVHRHDQQER
jgi:hypothetical protein